MEPKSRQDAEAEGLKRYFTGEPCVRGHVAERFVSSRGCVQCSLDDRAAWGKRNPEKERARARKSADRWKLKNPELAKERARIAAKKWADENRELVRQRARERYQKNRGAEIARRLEYRKRHPEKDRAASQRWNDKNKERMRPLYKKMNAKNYRENKAAYHARVIQRKAAGLQRTPGWADLKAIEEFYRSCPPGYHVDHIIPLQGKYVSGLHVENNLQYLPAAENLSKGNKFTPGDEPDGVA